MDVTNAPNATGAPARMLRLGTRGSALAIWQTERVVERLRARNPDVQYEIQVISTQGDRDKETPLSVIGGQGVFIKELESAILSGDIDCAVHSLKDLPSMLPDNLVLAAILERHDPRDVLISRHGGGLDALPAGARVGTSSRRRIVQLKQARPDIEAIELRGNVDTRLAKVFDKDGPYDAGILAAAGVMRMERDDAIAQLLGPDIFTPAPGQAALAVECREDDLATRALLATIHDQQTAAVTDVERAFLRGVGGGCRSPIGAYATWSDGRIHLRAMLASEDLSRVERIDDVFDVSNAIEQVEAIAADLVAKVSGDRQ